jgi:hypothetical protein
MPLVGRLRHNWPSIVLIAATLGVLALLWIVRDTPLQPLPWLRVDALSAFFGFATLGGCALALIGASSRPATSTSITNPRSHAKERENGQALRVSSRPFADQSARSRDRRALALLALLLVGYLTTATLAIAGAYLLLALLMLPTRWPAGTPGETRLRSFGRVVRHGLLAAPGVVAAGALLVGYGALALRGVLRYDERTAGGALDGFVFWFVLLAACIASAQLYCRQDEGRSADEGRRTKDDGVSRFTFHVSRLTPHVSRLTQLEQDLVRIAWLYPLVRLYSLGPWNAGWSFATMLLGGAAAVWAAGSAFVQTEADARRRLVLLSYLGLALAGLGLATSAGIVAGCYGLLVYLVLAVGSATAPGPNAADQAEASAPGVGQTSRRWLLSGAIPFTAPFVAAWLLIGAGHAGGVILLSGVVWLVALINALTTALTIGTERAATRALTVAAAASVALGIGAPLVVLLLIQPVVEQLQGGLTLYGDVNIWPWVGLATIDAGHTPVTTLPAIAIAGLMLVLSALVYLIVRLRGVSAPPTALSEHDAQADAAQVADDPRQRLYDLLASLRSEVAWLGGGAGTADEERPVDGE